MTSINENKVAIFYKTFFSDVTSPEISRFIYSNKAKNILKKSCVYRVDRD